MDQTNFKDMQGKVAIITGATSGIGFQASRLFAQHGIKVVLAGRNEHLGYTLEKEINSAGGEALYITTYVENYNSVKTMIEKSLQRFGQIDYAFNNAGIEGRQSPLAELEEHDYDEVLNINLKGVWHCMKFQLKAMKEKGGAIVNVSSNVTKLGVEGMGFYAASKAGVESLTRVAAIEYGKFGIRVNAISPGAVNTPMLRRNFSDGALKHLSDDNPLKKIAQPEDVAQTVLWLCSSMANHINGNIIFIDGGALLQTTILFETMKPS